MLNIVSIPSDTLFHIKRAFSWRLANVGASAKEMKVLDEADPVISNETARAFLIWRRSVLIVSLPSLLISSILGMVSGFMGVSKEGLTGIGIVAELMPGLAPSFLLLGAVISLCRWSSLEASTKYMNWAWLIALAMPMWPALVPTDFFYKEEYRTQDDFTGLIIRFGDAATYVIQLMPLIHSIPTGLIKGSLRIRGLLPMSSMSGWVIVITAPFLALVMFAALMMLLQVAGDWLLIIAATFLTFSPVLYVAFKKFYTAATTEKDEVKLDKIQRWISVMQLVGSLLALLWAFTYTATYGGVQYRIIGGFGSTSDAGTGNTDNDNNLNSEQQKPAAQQQDVTLLTLTSGISLFFESLGRSFVTNLIVADAVLRMTLVHWNTEEIKRRSHEGPGNDECLGELYGLLLPVADAGAGMEEDDAIKLEHEEDDAYSIGVGVNDLEEGAGEQSNDSTPTQYPDRECSSLHRSSSN